MCLCACEIRNHCACSSREPEVWAGASIRQTGGGCEIVLASILTAREQQRGQVHCGIKPLNLISSDDFYTTCMYLPSPCLSDGDGNSFRTRPLYPNNTARPLIQASPYPCVCVSLSLSLSLSRSLSVNLQYLCLSPSVIKPGDLSVVHISAL